MKKILIVLIAAAMILTLFACGKKNDQDTTAGTGESSGIPTVTGEPTDTEKDTASETETGTESGTESVTGTGTESVTGTDTEPVTGTDTGTDTGAKTEPDYDEDDDPVPNGGTSPENLPDAADHSVDHTVKYTAPDGTVIREETVPATGHVWKYESDENGHRQVCALCGATGETAAHDLDGSGICRVCGYGCEHAFTDSVVSPGCTTAGYTVHTCSKCGYAYSSDYVKAAGHKYAERVESPATCTEKGALRYTCAVCGEFFIVKDAIPVTDHNYVNGVCVNCGQSEPQEISVLPPDYDTDRAEDTEEESLPSFWTGEEYELPEVPIG